MLIAGKGKIPFLISFVVFFAMILAAWMIRRKTRTSAERIISFPISSSMISLILAALFFIRWSTSGRIRSAAAVFQLPAKQTCVLIALFLALLSIIGIDRLIGILFSLLKIPLPKGNFFSLKGYILLYIFLTICLEFSRYAILPTFLM